MSDASGIALFAACVLILTTALAPAARAQEVDCLRCHQAMANQKTVHPALSAGCAMCHPAIDATSIPHRVTGAVAKGLLAEPPGLCHLCHDRAKFEEKFIHVPVGAGMCVLCHDPHSSEQPKLLKMQPAALCLQCHANVKNEPHVIAGFASAGHPLGDEKKELMVADPLSPGRGFNCGSCHEAHRSEFARLLRIDPQVPTGYCQHCHKF